MNIYYFNDLGDYDKYNPSYFLDGCVKLYD